MQSAADDQPVSTPGGAENWTHEEFLVACLQREVAARQSHVGESRIRAARLPARKSLEEFEVNFRSLLTPSAWRYGDDIETDTRWTRSDRTCSARKLAQVLCQPARSMLSPAGSRRSLPSTGRRSR
jgi:hypothetical protein